MPSCQTLLSGIRILDMSRILAGPFASMVLADLGAEVIKIENPSGGDETRTWGPPFLGSESAYFLSINRNKKSVAINIKHDEGSEIVKKLAGKSDILIENFVPGKLDSYGLGYSDLQKLNEGLIYCSLTGYGPDGPYAVRGGYDVIAASIGGLNYITGPEDGDPCRPGVAMTDISTGLYAHGAILAALWNRQKTGKGQKIDCNLLSTQVAVLSHIVSNYLNAGVVAKRWGTGHGNIVPYQSFHTKDGRFLTVGAGNDRHFKTLCDLLNLEHLVNDKRFKTNENRVLNRKQLIPVMQRRFLEKTLSEWLSCLENCGFPYGPINDIEETFSDPQVAHNDLIMEFEHPNAGGKIRVAGPPVRYSEDQAVPAVRPPVLGEHTKEVLLKLTGLSSLDIERLLMNKVIVDGSASV